ncbi:FAD-dependent oxidoreductase [bacterium]|nr:FAD-dependent oxidoreductase [bacterium]
MNTEFTENLKDRYPLIIIGAGPAGLTASIYASRYKLEHLVIGEAIGGLAFEAHKICNFPIENEISGRDITKKMQEHARSLGANIIMDKVIGVQEKNEGENKIFKITTQSNKVFLANTVLLALGTERRRLDLPGENRFIGKGISYCATCDAMFYQNKTVAVVGGSNSANTSSLYLAEIAKKVYQIYRRDKLRGETSWIEQILHNQKIKVIYNTNIIGLKGEEKLEKIVLDTPYQGMKELAIDGLFVEIGSVPQKALIKDLSLQTDENGYIKVTSDQRTNRLGIWAAGDITTNSNNFRQIITACSEGAIAAESIFKFIKQHTS